MTLKGHLEINWRLKRSPEDTNPLVQGLFEGKKSVIEKALDFNHFHIIKWYYENSRSDINQELLTAVMAGNRIQFQKLLQPVLDYNGVHKSWTNQYKPGTLTQILKQPLLAQKQTIPHIKALSLIFLVPDQQKWHAHYANTSCWVFKQGVQN